MGEHCWTDSLNRRCTAGLSILRWVHHCDLLAHCHPRLLRSPMGHVCQDIPGSTAGALLSLVLSNHPSCEANIEKIVHIASHFYSIVMAAMKTVILVEWIQIFVPRGTRNGFVYTSWVAIAVNLTFYIIAIILLNVSARPYRRSKILPAPRPADGILLTEVICRFQLYRPRCNALQFEHDHRGWRCHQCRA